MMSWAALRTAYLQRRYTVLLAACVCALMVRPLIGESDAELIIFGIAMVALLMIALLTISVDELVGEREMLTRQHRRRSIIGWVLAVPAIAERFYMITVSTPQAFKLGAISWLLFFAFITWSLLRTLLRHKEVSGETISLSVAIYLLIGVTWGMFYIMLAQFNPDAFRFDESISAAQLQMETHLFPTLIYFSMTTLSTIGFGDILPMSMQARYAAVAEGITGQFYIAILVARLVSTQMSRR